MTETNKIRTIVFDDIKMVALGITVAAGIVVAFLSCLVLAFAVVLAESHITTAEVLSPNNNYVASVDTSGGGATGSRIDKIYVQSKGKTIFDPRVLVGTLASAQLNENRSGVKLSWLPSNDLQITYQSAKTSKLHTEIIVNGQKIRIYQNVASRN